MGEFMKDAARYRYLLANATRMSEPLVNAKTGAPTGEHNVSLVVQLRGEAPWATEAAFSAAVDEAIQNQ